MNITTEQLREIAPFAPKSVDAFVPYLNKAMAKYGINTPQRAAMFLSQLAHESGSYRYTKEIADGSAYEGRKDLGNTEPGDGKRYKGRGLIQLTGKANYILCGKALEIDLLKHPELLETPQYAVMSAGWFWSTNNLNTLTDKGGVLAVTRRINGGTNGLASREEFYNRALKALTVA